MYSYSDNLISCQSKKILNSNFISQLLILYKCKQIFAFTLAEVLITLLIIGVVSSLVIPALVQSSQDAELKTALKSFYSYISNTTKLIAMENGGSVKGLFNDASIMRDYYANKMNITRKCDVSNSLGNCWHMNTVGIIKRYDGANWVEYTVYPSMALTNGTLLFFSNVYKECDGQYSGLAYPVSCGLIRVDINGFKGPNRFGYDIFDFHVLPTFVAPRGGTYDTTHSCSNAGDHCAFSVLKSS